MALPVPKSCHLNCISAGPSPTATGCQASPGCPSFCFFRTEVHGRFPGFVINLRKRPDKVTASSSDLKRRLYQYNQMKRRQGKKALHNTLQSPFNQYSFECAFSRSATAMNYSSCSQKKIIIADQCQLPYAWRRVTNDQVLIDANDKSK